MKLIKILYIAIIIISSYVAQAQNSTISPQGRLVYSKIDNNITQIVTYHENDFLHFDIEEDGCAYTSDSGRYAIQSTSSPTNVKIWRLTDETLLMDQLWDVEWLPCNFDIRDDKVVGFSTEAFMPPALFKLEDGILIPHDPELSTSHQFPNLPNGFRELFYRKDPTERYYLYERCMGEVLIIENRPTQCSILSDAVIYDTVQQEIIYEIVETDIIDLKDTRSVSWSPNGHYVTFSQTLLPEGVDVSHPSLVGFDLRIFDTTTHTFVEPIYTYVVRDRFIPYTWSPDSKKMAFWIIGEREAETNDRSKSQLLIFDSELGQYIETDAVIQITGSINQSRLYWSPDSSSLVFISPQDELVLVDASTGNQSIIDTHVEDFLAWHPIAPPIANAGDDQILESDGRWRCACLP